jgi:hypothetical protein
MIDFTQTEGKPVWRDLTMLVRDVDPDEDALTKGTPVIAQWHDMSWYEGVIDSRVVTNSVPKRRWNVNFEDGQKRNVALHHLRLVNHALPIGARFSPFYSQKFFFEISVQLIDDNFGFFNMWHVHVHVH